MSFDISRFSFNPWNDYQGVVMQQGRVQLDSDWNEWQAEFLRRIQAGTLDIFGRAAYPASTPGAFKIKISASGSSLTIGAGRMYVDGLLAENHGLLPPAFTVVALEKVADSGTYGIEITPGSGAGEFNLSLIQMTGGTTGLIGSTLSNVTLASLESAISSDPALAQVIQIENVASAGQPAPSVAPYMLIPSGPNYAVTIPLVSAVTWDPALAELSGAPFIPETAEVDIDYSEQPYYPGARITGTGPYLVYLDVWKRAVTPLQQPNLIEQAVGIDTTGRLQTVWQVKVLEVSSSVTCSTPDADIPGWSTLLLPPAGNLTTGVVQSAPAGPCALTPDTGYTGMENQLYRVEIHQAGIPIGSSTTPVTTPLPAGTATFKWSRENASVATGVSAITTVSTAAGTVSQLAVQSLGRDQALGFSAGDWIEVTDDYLELHGSSGQLHQIASVSLPDLTITLMDQIATSAIFPALEAGGLTFPNRHTRIIRWDQQGKVYLSDGATVYFDSGPATSGGAIPVPPPGSTLILENGVTVAFGLSSAVGQFNIGDFWNFAARAADGTVESLNQAPPLGIHHHYARLAVVDLAASPPNPVSDCRTPWPPPSTQTSDGIHVLDVRLAQPASELPNDSSVQISQHIEVGLTIRVICDGPIDPISAQSTTCYLTVNMPYLQDVLWVVGSQNTGTAELFGFHPLILPAKVRAVESEIDLTVLPLTARLLYDFLASGPTSSLLTRLTLKGSFIWAKDNPTIYLDGKAFGIARTDPDGVHIGLHLPKSGNGTLGSDFEMWFWLVRPVLIQSVTFSPNSVMAGQTANGTVTLNGLAPRGGAVITLSGNNSSIGTVVPTSVTVQEGQLTAPFTVTNTSVPAGAASASLQVTASYPGSSAVGTLTINQQVLLTGLTFNPNPLSAAVAGITSTGTLTLSGPAPAGGAMVTLSGNQPNFVSVPASATIPANQPNTTFAVTTLGNAGTGVQLQVTATYAGQSVQGFLNLRGIT
jgi:hypothetical protein